MQIFIEEVMRETQRVAILTTLFVGFRVGEVLALKISDLDLEKQTLSVNKNLIRVPTTAISPDNPNIQILNYDPKKKTHLIVQNTPKTSTSHREISDLGRPVRASGPSSVHAGKFHMAEPGRVAVPVQGWDASRSQEL